MKIGSVVKCIRIPISVICGKCGNTGRIVQLKIDTSLIKLPKINGIYIVRSLYVNSSGNHFILLEEIINQPIKTKFGTFPEPPFAIECFRELMPPIENIEEFISKNTKEESVLWK